MKKKAAKVRKRKKTSPYAKAAQEISHDPYDVQTETWNSGPTIVAEADNAPGWWSRMWRRVFG